MQYNFGGEHLATKRPSDTVPDDPIATFRFNANHHAHRPPPFPHIIRGIYNTRNTTQIDEIGRD
jgi:hypothetical protein